MQLKAFTLKNFRGYHETTISIQDFTTIVGINDSGKSTIFEAMDIFFGNSKMDSFDRNIYHEKEDIELTGVFDSLPEEFSIEKVPTSFTEEYLLNKEGLLEIKQIYSGQTLKKSEVIVANFPTDKEVQGIHTMKITDLRKKFSDILEGVDGRVSSQIRKAALAHVAMSSKFEETEIPLTGAGDMKDISKKIHEELPVFQLFKSDRSNTDSDSEIQDPIKAIVKSTIAENEEIRKELSDAFEKVQDAVKSTTAQTLFMLQSMNKRLASELNAEFQNPKWESLFKFTLGTDSGIPLNKRGSGVRRLILLNFFRAEAKKRIEEAEQTGNHEVNVLYAFEEPETSQHPLYQQMLIESFKDMASSPAVQVLITTHSPAIAKIVPENGIHLVQKLNAEPEILQGEEALDGVVRDLGLIADVKLYDDQIWGAVAVEGPDDMEFFQNMYNQLSEAKEKRSVIFVSGGGTTVLDVLNARFLRQLRLEKRVMIVDGDDAGSSVLRKLAEYKGADEVQTIQLRKATLEFYLPYLVVKKVLSGFKQSPFDTSESQWNSGTKQFMLTKPQKKHLKSANVYGSVDAKDLTAESLHEIKKIIAIIDEKRS